MSPDICLCEGSKEILRVQKSLLCQSSAKARETKTCHVQLWAVERDPTTTYSQIFLWKTLAFHIKIDLILGRRWFWFFQFRPTTFRWKTENTRTRYNYSHRSVMFLRKRPHQVGDGLLVSLKTGIRLRTRWSRSPLGKKSKMALDNRSPMQKTGLIAHELSTTIQSSEIMELCTWQKILILQKL